MKRCSQCKKEKDEVLFPKHSTNGKIYINSWCRQCCREIQRKKYHQNREHKLKLSKEWNRKNPEKVKFMRKRYFDGCRAEALKRYGNKCQCCGESKVEFLAIDHIEGLGNQHRRERRENNLPVWLKKNNYPKGFQVLCHNCNMAKSIYKICPHQSITN